jgi:Cdc6-like AAA superfamily ATPase
VHSIFDILTTLFDRNVSPEKVLQKISETLQGENKHLILVLDDLDRNDGVDFDDDDIEATLHRFRETKTLSFILTGFPRSAKDKRIDFVKLCD